ncbi:MAG: SGNH/GDSL hydrolase family protein [Gemmatimonas sp.]
MNRVPRHTQARPRALAIALAALCIAHSASAQRPAERWVATWTTSMIGALPYPYAGAGNDSGLVLTGRTLRQIVRVSAGGTRVRLRVSNEYGLRPLIISATRVALSKGRTTIDTTRDRRITFNGHSSVTIRAGANMVSDPVSLTVPDNADLAISFYFADTTRGTTLHFAAHQRNYRSVAGNLTAAADFVADTITERWHFVTGVDVVNPRVTGVIVAFGNSITDGTATTTDANTRWPNILATRLMASREPPKAVVNAGIGGNQVTSPLRGPSALQRFDRDVLMQPGVTHVIVLEGVNDISRGTGTRDPRDDVSAAELIAAHAQLVQRAHERGLVILGGTLTPVGGMNGLTPEHIAKRDALNAWIRTSGVYDGVIDFDRITRDPADTSRFLPAYDSGDHLHPNDAGYRAMGDAIHLGLFRKRPLRR